MKIVIDQNIPFLQGLLEPWFEVVYASQIDAALVRDASALLVRTRTRCDAALLAGSAVEFIGTATIGHDHIDIEYCRQHGIQVVAAAGSNARAVLQYVASALVHLARRQGWQPEEKTLGVVGLGHVGSLVAELGRSCGFRVIGCDPPRMRRDPALGCVSFEELSAGADIVTFHVPLNRSGVDRTASMADGSFFERLRPGATLINSSRGAVIDQEALKKALRSGKLAAAVLDVWDNEPAIDPALAALTTLGTMHIAGYSVQGKANASAMVVQALAKKFGLPLTGWYPPGVPPQVIGPMPDWPTLQQTIDTYYNITADDRRLRGHLDRFEALRNEYTYRTEYF
jgi:erythronate-4-phosphate dehydrogenase